LIWFKVKLFKYLKHKIIIKKNSLFLIIWCFKAIITHLLKAELYTDSNSHYSPQNKSINRLGSETGEQGRNSDDPIHVIPVLVLMTDSVGNVWNKGSFCVSLLMRIRICLSRV